MPRTVATRAFTLFEVLVSMLVLATAVLATLSLLPVGIKAQQAARSQLYASTMAETLMENFHNPIVSFRGHGNLAPDLDYNFSGAANVAPVPSWANRLRDANMTTSPYQPDIERYLAGWVTGVMPVPTEIARRFDSDGDEIQRHLQEGGQLYYVDPGYVRGLTLASAGDKSLVLHPAPEVQKLVFAVRGYAQQNALTSHPAEVWPWYELYPFPPAWVALRAHGFEYRRGPVSKMKRVDPVTGAVTWGPSICDEDMVGRFGRTGGDMAANKWYDGIIWGDGGHAGWSPVTFDKAPSNLRQIHTILGPGGTPIDQTKYPIDPLDAPAGMRWSPDDAGTVGWYQGRNWRYFSDHYGSASPWRAGWTAFQKLAGFNDAHRDTIQSDYGNLADSEHFERAGWLPVMAMLTIDDNPRYDAFWYDIIQDAGGSFRFRGGTAFGNESDVGTGVFPPFPPTWTGSTVAAPWSDTQGAFWSQTGYRFHTGAPHSIPLPPTYEMRASYRDKAFELWNAVAAGLSAYNPATIAKGYSAAGYVPSVTNTQVDCDTYEYSGAELSKFALIDPSSLPAGEAPVHPAQVLALSYLAHAAMLMTGWDVPVEGREIMARVDWDSLAWAYADAAAPGGIRYKDAKVLAADAARGASTVQITNDSAAELALYPGDEICFEQDYRQWMRDTEPNPYQAPVKGCIKYRIVAFARLAAGSSPAPVAVSIEPPLAHDYQATTGVDNVGNPFTNPPIPKSTGHPQQIIRVCSEYDRAFARTVHEMCMRWAASYGSENPYDWGAPRMMNHQTMVDKPLAIFDLFHDASRGPASPHAAVTAHDLPTATLLSANEGFYRWLVPPNRAQRTWFKENYTPATGPVCAISHQGPNRYNQAAWESLIFNPQLAPASSPSATTTSQWNWTSDSERYWLDRPFTPFHRCRQLVFWSVDWKSYEDAETAPSAILDFAKHARSIRTQSKNSTTEGDGVNVASVLPMYAKGAGNEAWDSNRIDSQLAGNPENALVWVDASRKRRYIDAQNYAWSEATNAYTRESEDILLGHWGADRNNNRRLDIGPIPRSARMRALSIARFNVYDPVMRLHDGN